MANKTFFARLLLALAFIAFPLPISAQTLPTFNAPLNEFSEPECQTISPHLVFPEENRSRSVWYEGMFCTRMTSRAFREAVNDQRNLYRGENLLPFALVFSGSAVLANTSMDQDFANWYQRRVRTSSTDSFAKGAKVFGEGVYFIPAGFSVSLLYCIDREWQPEKPRSVIGQFGHRTTRGYLVGAVPLVFGQNLLGASRPRDIPHHSAWRPFKDEHGISGHAFIGATPFITAAQMTDRPVLKGIFYTASTFPAWSRINDDAHYLSQAVLGWYLSYLSVSAVTQTELNQRLPKGMTVFPVVENNGTFGIGLHYAR